MQEKNRILEVSTKTKGKNLLVLCNFLIQRQSKIAGQGIRGGKGEEHGIFSAFSVGAEVTGLQPQRGKNAGGETNITQKFLRVPMVVVPGACHHKAFSCIKFRDFGEESEKVALLKDASGRKQRPAKLRIF